MILYKIGDVEVKLEYESFLCLIHKGEKIYKSSFNSFSELYEFIDKNLNIINEFICDNLHLYLEDGVLHNIYGPALIRHIDPKLNAYASDTSRRYFIHGKVVSCDRQDVRNQKDFENDTIYHIEWIKKPSPNERTKLGEHYIKHPIDIKHLIKLDKRKKKLNRIINDCKM